MKGIVYYTHSSRFAPEIQSVALRIGYLLCGHLAIAGDTIDEILMTEKDYKSLPLTSKISLLEKYKVEEESWPSILQIFKKDVKQFSQMKNKPAKVIGAFKRMEHTLMVIYDKMVGEMLQHKKLTGISETIKLVDGQTFGIYHQDHRDPELSEPEKNTISAGNMLKLILPDKEQGPEMLMLTSEFVYAEFANDLTMYTPDEAKAAEEQNICIELCFMIPNINFLTDFEMRTLRKQLSNPSEGFRKGLDEWLSICYDDQNHTSPLSYMREKLLPAAEVLKKSIEENEMLTHCKHLMKNAPGLEVNLALVPVEIIWKYYKHFNAIEEKTWQVLQDALQNGDTYRKRWPVFIISHSGRIVINDENPEPAEETEFPSTVKKFIPVD
jgi:hypothetical protein